MTLPDCAAACIAAYAEKREDDMCDDCYDDIHEPDRFAPVRPERGDD